MEFPEKKAITEMIRSKLEEVDKNQVALASEIGIDPSTLNRYLHNKTEISYERMREIWTVLREWEEGQIQSASELMTEGFTSTTLNETRREAAGKMRKNDFSQLPVRDSEDNEIIGIVTDADLMRVYDEEKPIGEIEHQHVIEVTPHASRQLVEDILDHGHAAVLVVDNDRPIGIITKADLLETVPSD